MSKDRSPVLGGISRKVGVVWNRQGEAIERALDPGSIPGDSIEETVHDRLLMTGLWPHGSGWKESPQWELSNKRVRLPTAPWGSAASSRTFRPTGGKARLHSPTRWRYSLVLEDSLPHGACTCHLERSYEGTTQWCCKLLYPLFSHQEVGCPKPVRFLGNFFSDLAGKFLTERETMKNFFARLRFDHSTIAWAIMIVTAAVLGGFMSVAGRASRAIEPFEKVRFVNSPSGEVWAEAWIEDPAPFGDSQLGGDTEQDIVFVAHGSGRMALPDTVPYSPARGAKHTDVKISVYHLLNRDGIEVGYYKRRFARPDPPPG